MRLLRRRDGAGTTTDDRRTRRDRWRFAVPIVCLAAGLLLAATHSVSGGDEIRRSDAPRLVDLVLEARESVDRLAAERDALAAELENTHGASPAADAALQAITRRSDELAEAAGLTPLRGPGLVVTLNDAQRDAQGRFPRDATPDDLVVHQQDITAVINALWAGGAEAMAINGQRVLATTAIRCVGNTLLLHGAVYSPPYVIHAIGDDVALRDSLDRDPAVTRFRGAVHQFQLGFSVTSLDEIEIPAHEGTPTLTVARPPEGPQ